MRMKTKMKMALRFPCWPGLQAQDVPYRLLDSSHGFLAAFPTVRCHRTGVQISLAEQLSRELGTAGEL